jgi:hypothetical protein
MVIGRWHSITENESNSMIFSMSPFLPGESYCKILCQHLLKGTLVVSKKVESAFFEVVKLEEI